MSPYRWSLDPILEGANSEPNMKVRKVEVPYLKLNQQTIGNNEALPRVAILLVLFQYVNLLYVALHSTLA